MVVLELIGRFAELTVETRGNMLTSLFLKDCTNCYQGCCQHLLATSTILVITMLSLFCLIMVDMIMDVLRALASPNLDIPRKTIDIALELITPRNIDEVVQALNKELRALSLRRMGNKVKCFTVVHLLIDFLGDSNVASAIDVVVFETNPKLKVAITTRLLEIRVCSCALWIIGEYCLSLSEVESGLATVKQYGAHTSKPSQEVNSITVSSFLLMVHMLLRVLSRKLPSPTPFQGSLTSPGNLRSLILSTDFYLAYLRLEDVQPSKPEVKKASSQALLVMVSALQLGQPSFLPHPIENDSYDRIVLCISHAVTVEVKAQISHAQPDDFIDFYHLKSRKDDLKRATGEFTKDGDDANKLDGIFQITGFSDPVYSEAHVTVHHYDIVLDVTVINLTKETLQNMCLELATTGDLKLVERPQNYTLALESSKQIRANIKAYSTEIGVIFGSIVYETSNEMEQTVVFLNDIHIDIMDYISPATCADVRFRTMWAEFEWENKVAVNTVIQDEKESLNHIIKSTNMKCLTALSVLDGDCGFLAANLYAKTVFGEVALVNVSIEKQIDGKLSGYIRIRSKTQCPQLRDCPLKQKGVAV
ncbi:hypothetical protein MKW92_048881 [Papaver armeniacum]|nr:hypothetical protein MKW92_048881 [Papaver armeniacum]